MQLRFLQELTVKDINHPLHEIPAIAWANLRSDIMILACRLSDLHFQMTGCHVKVENDPTNPSTVSNCLEGLNCLSRDYTLLITIRDVVTYIRNFIQTIRQHENLTKRVD